MSVKFFGQFLLEQRKIIKQELLNASEYQKSVNYKIGEIALDTGYLKNTQVEEICEYQQFTDKLFGEIAIELKYLNSEQLKELLQIQKNEKITLEEALIQKGYINARELEEALNQYRKESIRFEKKAYEAIKDAVNPEIPQILIDLTVKFLRRVADIDVEVIESRKNTDRITPFLWNVTQQFFGDSVGCYILSVNEETLLKIASGLLQEEVTLIDAFSQDGLKEFVNILLGNSVSKLSHQGIHLNLKAPDIHQSLANINISPKSTESVSIKLGSAEYDLQLSIAYSPIFK